MKKRTYLLLFTSILSVFFLVFVASVIVSPASGVPGTGTSITVRNEVIGAVPSSVWSCTITEIDPPKNSNPYKASFTLPAAGGGSYSFGGLRSGTYKVAETSKFGYYAIMTITSNKYTGSQDVSGWEVVINLASSEGKTVTFTNNAMPAFAVTGLIVPPPSDLGVSLPPLKPIPVQACLNVDINNDGRLDLVLGKPTVILVNLAGPSFPSDSQITVSVMFEGKVYNRVIPASSLASGNTIVSFYSADNPIVPSNAGNEQITGIYQVNGGASVALYTTDVTVKDTIGLSLYYSALTKSNYGSPATFSEMVQNSRDFIAATYPVKSVTATVASQSIAGSKPGTARDPYAGMLKDVQAVAQQAQLYMGGSAVGVAVAPNVTGLPDYFKYHGFPGAAGISFGPSVKGVIVLDGYWTVPAHEVAHTFGLYYGVPEEYQLPGNPFPASGVCYSTGAWRTGWNFMSVAEHKTTGLTWVNTDSTCEYLFRKTRVIPNDPDILLVNGIVYADGTVEFPLDWVHMQKGTPDTLIPGDYLLKFVDASGNALGQVSFGLSFSLQIDMPGVSMGGYSIPTNEGGFSFAIPYPPTGATKIQVVNSLTGNILATYYMVDVKSFSCSASHAGTEGLNDWYVSPVDVTITGTADPTAPQPYYVEEIHYILDGSETTVYGSCAQFTISTDGIHSLEYWGVDNLGNVGVHHTCTVKIDQTAPTVTLTPDRSADHNGWYNHAISWTVGASDDTSGVASKDSDFSYNGPDSSTASATASATDQAGNVGTVTVNFNYDATPPSIAGSRSPAANSYGWNNVDVTVSFTATDALSGIDTVTADTTLTGEGAGQHVLGIAVDLAGNSATSDVTDINIDKTAPAIIINCPVNAWYIIGQSVTADWSAADSHSGIDSVFGTVASGQAIDTSTVGAKTFTVTAFDKAGNTATITVAYNVGYAFGGFLSPIPNSKYNLGRTVPVKFQLTDSQGNFVTTAIARIRVTQMVNGEWREMPGSGNLLQYNSVTNTYQFNLDTKPLSVGGLQITVMLDDGTSYTVTITLT